MPVPILARPVRAGFPSPADDFVEEAIDLQRLLVANRAAIFRAHWRRQFYEIAESKKAPVAVEAVARIDAIFAIERTIKGRTPVERHPGQSWSISQWFGR